MPVPQKPRGEMTPEERARARRQAKWASVQRSRGKPVRITPEEFAEARSRVRSLHSRGMSYNDMAAQARQRGHDVLRHTFGNVERQTGLLRSSYDAIMSVTYDPPEGRSRGSYVPSFHAYRRVQALRAARFPRQFLADWLGMMPANIDYHREKSVLISTLLLVEEMYEKLKDRKPQEFGITDPVTLKRMKTYADKNRWPPPECWDTGVDPSDEAYTLAGAIDDPDGFPDWTGACGTEDGYRIHIRETIFGGSPLPLCQPCRQAVETRPPAPTRFILNRERLIEALRAHELTVKAIARRAMPDLTPVTARDTLYRWRDGSRSPRTLGHVKPLADVLGLAVEDLIDYTAMEAEADRDVLGNGSFNPYILTVALEMAGLTFKGAAEIIPASAGAIMKWARGEMKPSAKEKLVPLADHLGVDVEVFYS